MGLLLAIETSTRQGSLALVRTSETIGSDALLDHAVLAADQRHDVQLLAAISRLLANQQLHIRDVTVVAFGAGPGSFTGVRLAAAAAQGIGWAAAIPVLGISSIQALAVGVARQYPHLDIAVAVDARLGQIYWRWCAAGSPILDDPGVVFGQAQLAQLAVPMSEFVAVGDGWASSVVPSAWRQRAQQVLIDVVPRAIDVATLARPAMSGRPLTAAGEAQPRYLRGADAWQSA